jgi:hypothetical protein
VHHFDTFSCFFLFFEDKNLLVEVRAYQATTARRKAPQPALHTPPLFPDYIHLRVRLRIMNRPAGFSSTATLKTTRARASERQIACVS